MLPRISVVTASYNQGKFIGRTIDSVLSQDYPNLEHIVVDGMSTDDTPAVLARYSHLRVLREPDRGQAEAINKGFRLATGDILCFLNSDDTFLPGALHRVAGEIDPARGKHVVLGRCLFIDENDQPSGLEHPSAFRGHENVLKVWIGNYIPQPATFWTRQVWQECGPLDEDDQLVLDYDLMCRISRRYDFHCVDQVLATYRHHASSKSCTNAADDIYAAATRASQRYWGPPWRPRYWRLLGSLAHHHFEKRFGRRRRAAEWTAFASQAWKDGRRKKALAALAGAVALAPEVAVRRFFLRRLGPLLRLAWLGLRPVALTWTTPQLPEYTTVWRSYTNRHDDGCVGPHFATTIDLEPGSRWVLLEGAPIFGMLPEPLELEVRIDGQTVLDHRLPSGPFCLAVPVAGFAPGPHQMEVRSRSFVLVNDFLGNGDYRPLAFKLIGLRVSGADRVVRQGQAA
jgi:glycosyltransferase involved in cell wall biosynthesis